MNYQKSLQNAIDRTDFAKLKEKPRRRDGKFTGKSCDQIVNIINRLERKYFCCCERIRDREELQMFEPLHNKTKEIIRELNTLLECEDDGLNNINGWFEYTKERLDGQRA